jgi:hypothetical protein
MADYTEAADRTATLQQICHWGRRKEQRTEKKNKSRSKTELKSTGCCIFLALQVTLLLTAGAEGKRRRI